MGYVDTFETQASRFPSVGGAPGMAQASPEPDPPKVTQSNAKVTPRMSQHGIKAQSNESNAK